MRIGKILKQIDMRNMMMRTKILYYHDSVIKIYMLPTLAFMNMIKKIYHEDFEVIDCITKKGSNDMGLWLGKHWGSADIIICGQDNVPTIKMLFELKNCLYDLCVNPCISYPASTDLDRPMLNQIDEQGIMFEADEQPPIIYYGGTGVSKIRKEFQLNHKIVDWDWGFPAFDSHLKDLGLVNWHGHYPIHKHNKINWEDRHF